MKKTISLALAVCLLVLTFCLTSGAASAVWDTNVEPEITEEVQALFEKALDGLLGVKYTPIAVLGRQENALCILSRAAVVYPGAKPYYALVDISTADGNAELLKIRALSIDEKPEVEIDYGSSELYTTEEMDEAIALILEELNELAEAREPGTTFTQCIAFRSDFHSPVEAYGSWEADQEYTNWEWWLAREDGGSWQLMTWGY